jgi:hypothetical protein
MGHGHVPVKIEAGGFCLIESHAATGSAARIEGLRVLGDHPARPW